MINNLLCMNASSQALYYYPDIGHSYSQFWQNGLENSAHELQSGDLSIRDKYFVYIDVDASSEECLNIVNLFASNVDGNLK